MAGRIDDRFGRQTPPGASRPVSAERNRRGAMRIEGRCHCGNLGFELETERTWETIAPRECDCSFCRAHATRCVSDPAGRASVFVADPGGSSATSSAFGRRSSWSAATAASISAPTPRKRTEGSRPSTSAPLPTAIGRGWRFRTVPRRRQSRRARRRERWTPTALRLGVKPPTPDIPGQVAAAAASTREVLVGRGSTRRQTDGPNVTARGAFGSGVGSDPGSGSGRGERRS